MISFEKELKSKAYSVFFGLIVSSESLNLAFLFDKEFTSTPFKMSPTIAYRII